MTLHQASAIDWQLANYRYLMSAIAPLRQTLQQQSDSTLVATDSVSTDLAFSSSDQVQFQVNPPALEQLCQFLGLSSFERAVVLLCVGMELDPQWKAFCAAAQAPVQRDYPTWNLALAIAPSPHWSALQPDAPLRR